MQATETAKPQTTAEIINEARREDKNMQMFVLYRAGIGSEVASAGRSYLEMWQNAERSLGEDRKSLIKKSYVFDVMTAKEAAELVG